MRDTSNNAPLQNWGPTLGAHALPLRDYFAAQALAGLISQVTGNASSMEQVGELVANAAYALADAMLKERDK